MLDPRALLTFHRVCEAGTISGAARLLNVSQPSVSSAIAGLEARLGIRLFERSRNGIQLTAEGDALRLRAAALFHLLRTAESEVACTRIGIAGPLRVGGTPGALVSLLPAAIAALDSDGQAMALNVVERSDAVLNAMLLAGEIELAFVTTEMDEPPPELIETTLSRDPFALIVGSAHDRLPDRLSLRQAAAMKWVLPEAHGAFRRQVDALFVASGLAVPREAVRCDSLLTTKAIVRTGDRVTVLPREVASAELATGALRAITLEDATISRSIGLRHHREGPLSPLARTLVARMALYP